LPAAARFTRKLSLDGHYHTDNLAALNKQQILSTTRPPDSPKRESERRGGRFAQDDKMKKCGRFAQDDKMKKCGRFAQDDNCEDEFEDSGPSTAFVGYAQDDNLKR
jgi:hypothetical protein